MKKGWQTKTLGNVLVMGWSARRRGGLCEVRSAALRLRGQAASTVCHLRPIALPMPEGALHRLRIHPMPL